MEFDKNIYYGYIVKGDLQGILNCLGQSPEQTPLYNRFLDVFEREQYPTYGLVPELEEILAAYWQYFRDSFYLRLEEQVAEEGLRQRLLRLLSMEHQNVGLDFLEETILPERFQREDWYFLGGKTSGWYGPYVWKTMETLSYDVELPEGIQSYSVRLLDGFLMRSWMDCLSFGEVTPGGWTDGEGIIHCVRASYDLDSEHFRVSLLKHEAQHAMDLQRDKDMSSEDLEYRAKLVELIYSKERNLLQVFSRQADDSDPDNGHAMAAHRIMKGYADVLGTDQMDPAKISVEQIQAIARMLFEKSGNKE